MNFLLRQARDLRDFRWSAVKIKTRQIGHLVVRQLNKGLTASIVPFRLSILDSLSQRSAGRLHGHLANWVARVIYSADVWPACEKYVAWDDAEVLRVTRLIRKVESLLRPVRGGLRTRIAALEMLECGARILSDADSWSSYARARLEALEQLREQSNALVPGRCVDASSLANFGFFCHWDGLMKARQLGLIPDETIFVNVNGVTPMANRHLFDEYIAPHVENAPLSKTRTRGEYLPDPMRIGDTVFPNNHGALSMIETQWAKGGHAPFFSLTAADRAFGLSVLHELGMPKSAWFAAVHVRSSSYKGGESFRDAEVEPYLAAIKLIVECGGWVVRVGDPGSPPLPSLNCVIDIAHSGKRAERLDIFLLASCDVFVGGSSGPAAVSSAFGVPMALVDYLPLAGLYQSARTIYLPRLLRRIHDGDLLSFAGLYSPKYSLAALDATFRILGVEPVANTSDEITELVRQLLTEAGRLPARCLDPPSGEIEAPPPGMAGAADRLVQFNTICRDANPLLLPDSALAMAPLPRISDAFLEKHQALLRG